MVAMPAAAVAKPGGVIIPPLEVELGHSVTGTAHGQLEGTQLMIGVSWASIWPRDTPVDFSVGVICNMYEAQAASDRAARVTAAVEPEGDTDAGPFVDLALRTARGRHWRTWVGARGELIDQGEVSALGVAARASMELWAPAVAGDTRGRNVAAVIGTVAVSAWAELGLREAPRGASTFTAAGLGVRIPFMIAAGN